MSLPRLSIRAMLFGVLLVAGNCAALRLLGRGALVGLIFGIFSVLPMSNILAVACYRRLTRKSPVGPFFIGFSLSGAMAILIWFNFWLMADERWLTSALKGFERGLDKSIGYFTYYTFNIDKNLIKIPYYIIVFVSAFVLSGTLPQMILASTGGRIARRYLAKSSTTSPGSRPPG